MILSDLEKKIVYAGAGRGKNGGLKVRGNVKWSDVDTASIHDASVDGNIYKSSVHNYGGKNIGRGIKSFLSHHNLSHQLLPKSIFCSIQECTKIYIHMYISQIHV